MRKYSLGYFLHATYMAVNGTLAPGRTIVEYVTVSANDLGAVLQLLTLVLHHFSFPIPFMAGHNSKSK